MFTQVQGNLDRSQGGLGIGLAISRKVVEMHGGSIEARSPRLGKGTMFTIRLPAIEPPVRVPAASARTCAPEARPLRILVVGDNIDAAETLRMSLELGGHVVRSAQDEGEAIGARDEFGPDLVFLGIGLPDIDGYEVARRRREPRLQSTVLVALTGWGTDEDKRQSREAGFDLHLTKLVDPAAVDGVAAEYGRGRSTSA